MKEVPLTQGYAALVDDEDYPRISKYDWYAQVLPRNVYAVRTVSKQPEYMHRVLTDAPLTVEVDHIDGNGLNNQKQNLRHATLTQNRRNVRKRLSPTTSKYKGVYLIHRWIAEIRPKGGKRCIKFFASEEDAARQYNIWAKQEYGEFARLNEV